MCRVEREPSEQTTSSAEQSSNGESCSGHASPESGATPTADSNSGEGSDGSGGAGGGQGGDNGGSEGEACYPYPYDTPLADMLMAAENEAAHAHFIQQQQQQQQNYALPPCYALVPVDYTAAGSGGYLGHGGGGFYPLPPPFMSEDDEMRRHPIKYTREQRWMQIQKWKAKKYRMQFMRPRVRKQFAPYSKKHLSIHGQRI